MKRQHVLTCAAFLALFGSLASISPLGATCHVHSPLILDLDGGGVETTSRSHPVSFDIDADGVSDTTAWTWEGSEEAFLWFDRDGNGLVNNGGELFGDATLLPNGEEAANGFDALAVHDAVDQGGNGDRLISRRDSIWSALRLWVDRNHNGISESSEVTTLETSDVIAIGLLYWEANEMDGHANTHRFKGYYLKGQRTPSGYRVVLREVDDVYFLRRVGGS